MFKELETERLWLKNISKEDKEFIFEQFSNDDINKYLYDAEPMKELSEAQELIDFYTSPEPRGQHRWILVRKSDGAKIGTCGFHCWKLEQHSIETGYDLKKEYWGNGYMTEAMEAIVDFAEDVMDVRSIDAHIAVQNEKSSSLVKKLGFEFLGKTENYNFHGEDYLHYVFTKKRENCDEGI